MSSVPLSSIETFRRIGPASSKARWSSPSASVSSGIQVLDGLSSELLFWPAGTIEISGGSDQVEP
jgi:hypothetical protein